MTFNKLLLRIRKLSEEIRKETSAVYTHTRGMKEIDRLCNNIYQTHTSIWNLTGLILYSIIKRKKSRDFVTIVPGKVVNIIDSLESHVPPRSALGPHAVFPDR